MKLLWALLATTLASANNSADISDHGLKTGDFPRWKQLAPDIYFYEGLHAPDPDGHIINTGSVIVVTTDGVAVLDGQGDVTQTRAMVDTIKSLTSQPIRYVVVGSDHGDHTNGNSAFKDAFPGVELVTGERVLKMGKTELDVLNLGRAHTGHDLVTYLPKTRILFMSEVYLRGVFPAMRTAYPTEWVKTIEKAQAMHVSWYIPAHGFVDEPAQMKRDLEESRKAIAYVIAEGKRLHDAGVPCVVDKAASGVAPVPCEAVQKANWGPTANLPLRNSQQQIAIARVYQELDGKLP